MLNDFPRVVSPNASVPEKFTRFHTFFEIILGKAISAIDIQEIVDMRKEAVSHEQTLSRRMIKIHELDENI